MGIHTGSWLYTAEAGRPGGRTSRLLRTVLARRLLIFVAVLMGLTALAAGLATPPPRSSRDTQKPVIGTTVKPATPPVEATLSLSEPRTIAVDEGDQLQLSVQGDALDAVEIDGLG